MPFHRRTNDSDPTTQAGKTAVRAASVVMVGILLVAGLATVVALQNARNSDVLRDVAEVVHHLEEDRLRNEVLHREIRGILGENRRALSREIRRLNRRIRQLERFIRESGLIVPARSQSGSGGRTDDPRGTPGPGPSQGPGPSPGPKPSPRPTQKPPPTTPPPPCVVKVLDLCVDQP